MSIHGRRAGQPRVSVVIPAYNGAAYLDAAIRSVLAQRDVDLDLTVVDDCSSDGTGAIARSYSEVLYVPMTHRGGNAYISANVGIAASRGDYVAVLHQDDLWHSDKLAEQIPVMEADPRIGMSYSALDFIGAGGEHLWTMRSPHGRRSHVLAGVVELECLAVQNYINVCNAVVRRDVLTEVGGFPEDQWFAAEWATWIAIARRSRIAYVDRPLSRFRIHGQSQTQSRTRDTQDFRRQLSEVLDDLFADTALPLSLRRRERLCRANVELSTTLQCLYWSDRRGAWRSARRLFGMLPPWQYPALVRASAVVPRSVGRLRSLRRGS